MCRSVVPREARMGFRGMGYEWRDGYCCDLKAIIFEDVFIGERTTCLLQILNKETWQSWAWHIVRVVIEDEI
jgi:hypothetical protein